VKEKRKNYLLRMDEALWDDLNRWASQEFRSVNGQIELVLNRRSDAAMVPGKIAPIRICYRNQRLKDR
jgi:hypothetical protein